MDFIWPTPILFKKTPSLRLRLRVARLRLSRILFGICSVPVRRLFGLCSRLFRRGPILLIIIEAAMDNKLRGILETLPESLPRSCLDPVREFIDDLRRRGRTYREVVRILAERCEILVSVSTVHRFMHSRTRKRPRPRSVSPYKFLKRRN